jgi:signal peptidase I
MSRGCIQECDDRSPVQPGGYREASAHVADPAIAEAAATEPAATEPAATEPAATEAPPAPAPLRRGLTACRELVRAIATSYLSAYFSLIVWSMLPMILGWSPSLIVSGSMRPVIDVGDVVFFAPEDVSTLVPGRIVLVDDPTVSSRLLSHRLHRRNEDGTLITKGDANASPDSTPVRPEHVRGAARLVIPDVGRAALWNDENRVQAALWIGATAAALLLVSPPRRGLRSRRSADNR